MVVNYGTMTSSWLATHLANSRSGCGTEIESSVNCEVRMVVSLSLLGPNLFFIMAVQLTQYVDSSST